ncbi:MAG: LEA type 2 family protein [Campylobacterales bacterium]
MRLLLIAALLFLLGGCSLLQKTVQKPTAQVAGVELRALGFEGARLVMLVDVTNPNGFSVPLSGFDYKLELMDTPVLSGNNRQKVNLKANAVTRIEVPVDLRFAQMYAALKESFKAAEVPYGIQAAVILDVPVLGDMRLNVAHKGALPVPQLPKIEVLSAGLKNLTFTTVELDLKLRLHNPNVFDVKLEKLNYKLKVEGKLWAGADQSKSATAKAGQSATIELPVKLRFQQIGSAFYRKMTDKNAKFDYTIEGDSLIKALHPLLGEVQIPLSEAGKLAVK